MKLGSIFALFFVAFSGCKAQTKYILITGSSDGIGRETARQLARNDTSNYYIVLHGRNASRCENVSSWLRNEVYGVRCGCVVGDFLNLTEVVQMADTIRRNYQNLSVVLLNAGIFADRRLLTSDGLEETFQVNHLAHFLLINKLVTTLRHNAPSRIVVTSSLVHTWVTENWDDYHSNKSEWNPFQVYGRSKLYNVMMTDILAKKLQKYRITANSLHPGHLQTKLSRWGGHPVETVKTPGYLAISPAVQGVTGKYYGENIAIEAKNSLAEGGVRSKRLWNYSKKLLRNLGAYEI